MLNFLKFFSKHSPHKYAESKTDLARAVILSELKKLSIHAEASDIDFPKSLSHGDFSYFVRDAGMDLSKLPIANISHPYIEKVVVLGRFINFYLSKQFFADCIEGVIASGDDFGQNNFFAKKRVIAEYTDPNPFKQFHIGHLMSNSVGETISRLIAAGGADVTRANYQGDVGPHVAKGIWGIQKFLRENQSEQNIFSDSILLSTKTEFLGRAYVVGSNAYEDDVSAKTEIDAINKKIYERSDVEINRLYDWGRKVSLEHFEEIYKKLGTKFDLYFFESESAPVGMFAVEELTKKGILEKSDGAIVFKGEKYGLHTRVFVNSKGLPTYETKELGLSKMKFDRRDWDQSIVVTASEQTDYFSVLLKVLEFYDHRAANRTKHVTHGMLRFAEGKMSSRKGNVITGESLIADVEALVEEKMKDRDIPAAEKAAVVTDVAIAAIKYSVLKQAPGRDIIYDFEKSLSFEGDSGPYLQYTHARACSVLRKAGEQGISAQIKSGTQNETIGDLERLISRFPDAVLRAQKDFAPQLITTYLTNLAAAFNSYYGNNIILDEKNKTQSAYRVALTEAVKITLANGLNLLGIRAPERM
jgi:arginyl-tRNA synthetase